MVDLDAAYASCARVAAAHYENFPVASWLVPRPMRPHIAAVYAFARTADDFADEGTLSVPERLRLLDRWHMRLHGSTDGRDPAEPAQADEIFIALAATIRERSLPVGLFEDLLSAFRQDVTVTRYAVWGDVMDYCRRSANPIGRLVLRIAGYRDEALDRRSDAICTALQLTNFWQDLGSDFRRGRIYMPEEEMRAHGARELDLGGAVATEPWRRALASAVRTTRELFDNGRPLCSEVPGRLGLELRATWLGGRRVLERLEQRRFDPLRHRPRLSFADVPWCAWRLATWSDG